MALSAASLPFGIQSKLQSLSERIKCFSRKNTTGSHFYEIFYEKEKYCLSLLTAHIILKLSFPDKSKEVFMSIIRDYNTKNNKELKFEEFEKIHWIRIIQNEVILPEAVRYTVGLIAKEDEKINIDTFPENRRDMALCLASYYKTFDEPSITEDELEQILASLNLTEESILYLLKKNILKFNKDNKKYFWHGHINYQEQFENEVSALLWMLLKKQFPNLEKAFERYIYLADKTGLYFRKLHSLLSIEDLKLLYEQAVNYILNDQDLLLCDDELDKMRLDAKHHFSVNINEKAPNFDLKSNNICELLEKFDLLEKLRICEYTYQETRNYVYMILHLVFQYEQTQYSEKTYIKKFLTDLERPSIFFEMRHLLVNCYPHMTPFLVSDIELIPTAFKMLDDMNLNDNMFFSGEGAGNKLIKEHKFHNEIWLELFEITTDYLSEIYQFNNNDKKNGQLMGEALAGIFIGVINKIFEQYHSNVSSRDFILNIMQERYTTAYQIFKKAKTKFSIFNKGLYVKSKLSYFLLPYIIENIELRLSNSKAKYYHYFDFKIANLDILIDMLELTIDPYDSIEMGEEQKNIFNNLVVNSLKCIYDYLTYFFTAEKIDVIEYDLSVKTKDAEIIFDIDKLNITNWALLVMLMEKYGLYQRLMNAFETSVKFDKSKNQFEYPNKNQYYRIRVMLKILLHSYLNLKKEEIKYAFPAEQQEKITANLEKSIIKYAIIYSKNDIQNNRIDAFYEIYLPGENTNINDTLNLLLMALNHFPVDLQKEFVKGFFHETINLMRILAAVNSIESDEVKKIASDYIMKINIDEYIDSCSTVTEWEETLIEAVNSEKHWYFAESLLRNIKKHYERRNINNDNNNFFIYQIELSLALRNNDFEKLKNVQFKRKGYGTHNEYNPENIKTYFTALFYIENDTDYDKAINLLSSLSANDEMNLRYSLLLYRARFLKSIKSNDADLINGDEIDTGWHEWQNFIKRLGKDGEKIIESHQESINLNSLPYYIIHKDYVNFDHAITKISKSNELLYSSNLAKLIYDFYIERGLENEAFRFLNKAADFFRKNGKKTPVIINELLINPGNQVLKKLRGAFRDIITLNYKQIPFVTPPIINGKKELRVFILYELIKSLQKLQDRIMAIDIEDNYTDLIQSILSMRFPFYGWNISEQPHRGASPAGKRAGEVDLAVTAGGEDIALIEALILKTGNLKKTSEHILKSFSYSNRSDQYYIVVYYQGKKEKFNYYWEKYKGNIAKIVFPKNRILKKPKSPFIDLNDEFDNIQTFKVAKTSHKGNFELYHIMVDFSCLETSTGKKLKSTKKHF